jgi:hypothetical protein
VFGGLPDLKRTLTLQLLHGAWVENKASAGRKVDLKALEFAGRPD